MGSGAGADGWPSGSGALQKDQITDHLDLVLW